MIQLTKGQTQYIYLTLTEKQLLQSPNYLFVLTNRSSNNQVKFVKLNNTDVSSYKDRYNKFQIVVNDYFGRAHLSIMMKNAWSTYSNCMKR